MWSCSIWDFSVSNFSFSRFCWESLSCFIRFSSSVNRFFSTIDYALISAFSLAIFASYMRKGSSFSSVCTISFFSLFVVNLVMKFLATSLDLSMLRLITCSFKLSLKEAAKSYALMGGTLYEFILLADSFCFCWLSNSSRITLRNYWVFFGCSFLTAL